MSSNTLDNFVVYLQAGDEIVQLPHGDKRYRAAEKCVSKGLDILQSERGFKALVKLAKVTIETRWSKELECIYDTQDTKFEKLDRHVKWFLARLREDFPCLYLDEQRGEAMTSRYVWANNQTTADGYIPKYAAKMHLHALIIENMVAAKHTKEEQYKDDYEKFLFLMSITVAHEICHLLTGFLTGTERALTPATLSIPGLEAPEGAIQNGEAGFYWEREALGGIVEFFAPPEDPKNYRQAGIPYIFDDWTHDARGKEVSMTTVRSYHGNRFQIPILKSNSTRDKKRSRVARRQKEMSHVRNARLAAIRDDDAAAQSDQPMLDLSTGMPHGSEGQERYFYSY